MDSLEGIRFKRRRWEEAEDGEVGERVAGRVFPLLRLSRRGGGCLRSTMKMILERVYI